MRPTMLQLPPRSSKPRTEGLTMMVDGGLPTRQFQDVVESGAEFLDFVKFGWGTAIVTADLQRKIDVLKDVGVDYYFGGHPLREVRAAGPLRRLPRPVRELRLPLRGGLERHHRPLAH